MANDEHFERGYKDAVELKPPTLPTSGNSSFFEKLAFGIVTGGMGFVAEAIAPLDEKPEADVSYTRGYAAGRQHQENVAWYERMKK